MARRTPRRDSKGRFLPSGSRSRKRPRSSRGVRGLGNMITVRPSMRGLGALRGREMVMESIIPNLMGGGVSALTTFGLRYFVDPSKGKMQHGLVKYAPLYGGAAGTIGAGVLYYTEGKSAAFSAMLSNAFVTAAALAADYLSKSDKGAPIQDALTHDFVEAPPTDPGAHGIYGVGAIVPEYNTPSYSVGVGGLGAITAEVGGDNPYGIGYGNEVALSGVNVGSFGTPSY